MTEIVENLAKAIYMAEVSLAIEGEFDSPYYKRDQLDKQSDARIKLAEQIAYEDLPQQIKDSYFEMAQAILKPLREKMLI